MKLKQTFFLLALTLFMNSINAQQIKNFEDFIINNEELKTLTVQIAKNYVMTGVLPNYEKSKEEFNKDKEKFNELIVGLIDKSPNEEIEVELQKLNLTWTMFDKITKRNYDENNGTKALDYSEKILNEVNEISNMVLDQVNLKSIRLIKASSTGKMLSQKLLLYFIANKLKVERAKNKERFKAAKEELVDIIDLLSEASKKDPVLKNDQGVELYLEMIKDSYVKVNKTLSLKAKVHPITANLIVNQLTENFRLLNEIIYNTYKN